MLLGRGDGPSLLFIVQVLAAVVVASTQEPPCCSLSTGSCRSTCSQMSLVEMAANAQSREQRVGELQTFCPAQMASFWQCMNKTMEGYLILTHVTNPFGQRVSSYECECTEEMIAGESWSGRGCCPIPQSQQCQLACATAGNRDDLMDSCRQSDEVSFYTCLDRQEFGESCCSNARTTDCKVACSAIFKSQLTPSRDTRDLVEETCTEHSPKVMQCVKNFTRVSPVTNPHRYMHCCEKAATSQCRDTCRRTLRTKTIGLEIIDSMAEGGCGPPLPHDKVWQCFLQSSDSVSTEVEVSRIDRMGMDAVKLHCCFKASAPNCRRLCLKTFSNEWTRSWDDFNRECLSQLSEDALSHCIDEVEEPCELGCDGLSYCTNFNNRPTELFRSCSRQADDAARYDIALWTQQGYLGLPGLQLPVRNISQCSPDMWKAVACALQVKPCHRHSHANRICREDCYSLLSRCMDWSRMPPGHTADSLCARLSPDHPETPCIGLSTFLVPSEVPYVVRDEITTPCRGEPCNASQVCSINRSCQPGRACLPYTCTPGCKLGEVSQYLVPVGSYIRIPLAAGQKGCLKICQCAANGAVERCQPMPCFPLDACWVGSRKIDHATWFYMDCNMCSCYAGELTCSKKQCQDTSLGYTSLPCSCPARHVPVCGRNGNTYPSSCLAKCAGLSGSDFEFGACSEKDPCEGNPCGDGKGCVPFRKVCLSLLHKPCLQYQCVDLSTPCSGLPHAPVCDTEGQEHPNVCYLVRYSKQLAHRGPCLPKCVNQREVCAINGETYATQCAAQADYLAVDYTGSCSAIGPIGTSAVPRCDVTCQPLARQGCLGVTPPGACCPVCAGALRFLYSQKQIDRALYALRGSAASALTVSALLSALERQVRVAECSLRGFLTVELDLFVMVESNIPSPTSLQLDACVGEAEKLASLVRRASPRVMSELGLSALTAATIVHTPASSAAHSSHAFWAVLVTLTILALLGRPLFDCAID